MTDDDLRDSFGEELTEALRIRSRPPASTDTAVAVRHHARRTKTRRVLATLAAALAATGIGLIATRGHGTTHIRVESPPSSSTSTTTTVPSSFEPLTTGVEDWTWVSDDHGWALVRKPCGTTVCIALRETTDGGGTWHSLPAPDALERVASSDSAVACVDRPCISSVRFATSKIGWLFGPALFDTEDGGHTWTRVPGPPVLAVEAANGVAMRVTTTDRTYRDCTYRCTNYLDRKRLDSSSWQRLPGNASPTLLLQGNDVYDVDPPNFAGAGLASLRLSRNRGTTWTKIDDPCNDQPGFGRTASASAAPGGVLIVLCVSTDPSSAAVQVSTNRGKTFGPRHGLPRVPLNTFGPIAAASAKTIAIAYSDPQKYGVLVTQDGGKTWQPTLVPAAAPTRATTFIPSLGWEDAQTARASFNTDAIWTTRDGGRSWIENRVTP